MLLLFLFEKLIIVEKQNMLWHLPGYLQRVPTAQVHAIQFGHTVGSFYVAAVAEEDAAHFAIVIHSRSYNLDPPQANLQALPKTGQSISKLVSASEEQHIPHIYSVRIHGASSHGFFSRPTITTLTLLLVPLCPCGLVLVVVK